MAVYKTFIILSASKGQTKKVFCSPQFIPRSRGFVIRASCDLTNSNVKTQVTNLRQRGGCGGG